MADYTLLHTGAQVDAAVQKALDITSTPANIDAAVANENATTDYIVVSSTIQNGWTIRRWNSGLVEMWKSDTITTNVNTAAGSLYCSPELTASLPPNVLGSILAVDVRPIGGVNYLLVAQVTEASATNGNFKYSLISSWSHTSTSRVLWYHVVGWARA